MSAPSSMRARRRILIVDDDPAARELLTVILDCDEWQVESAPDGESALRRVEAGRFDLILTDIHMPGMDGLTLLRRIHEIVPGAPVIVMTADNIPSNVAGALRGQAFGYITKPISSEGVLGAVQRALESSEESNDIEVISSLPNWISLQVRCKMSTAERLLMFLREMESALGPDDREMIGMAFRELLMNAIEHGGHFDPEQKVTVTYIRAAHAIIYHLHDPGPGFSMTDLPHAAISYGPDQPVAHLENRAKRGIRPGGFGIMLTRNFADELLYSEKANEVMFIKYLDR